MAKKKEECWKEEDGSLGEHQNLAAVWGGCSSRNVHRAKTPKEWNVKITN